MELTGKPKIAGILLISMGSVAIVGMLLGAFILWTFSEGVAEGYGTPGNAPLSIILAIGLILAIPGIIALIGGFNALKRQRWGLALAGSICAMLYFNVIGIPAMVILLSSRNEFAAKKVSNV
jgi:hypothetical protein